MDLRFAPLARLTTFAAYVQAYSTAPSDDGEGLGQNGSKCVCWIPESRLISSSLPYQQAIQETDPVGKLTGADFLADSSDSSDSAQASQDQLSKAVSSPCRFEEG